MDGAVIKFLAALGFLLSCSGCVNSQGAPSKFCGALQGKGSQKQFSVADIYVFGDYQHGVIAVSRDCPGHAKRVRVAWEEGESKENSAAFDRVIVFKKALLLRPKTKSGMFKVDAKIYIDEVGDRIEIKDVAHFEEVSRIESDEVFKLLDKSRRAIK